MSNAVIAAATAIATYPTVELDMSSMRRMRITVARQNNRSKKRYQYYFELLRESR